MPRFWMVAVAILLTVPLLAVDPYPATPLMKNVEPDHARPGDTVTATGDYLNKNRVAELFLTNGKIDYRVEIKTQTDTKIVFKVPVATPTGRYNLMVLVTGKDLKLIEEPVTLVVE